ncbi:MAG: GAF domain-containing sensor histidine kinase [Candidatus Zixiibacteriota bacterium]|nr:MAG: GAF domain-containing sensor histidine kinase [candidate division Zixibacteria bacterium]
MKQPDDLQVHRLKRAVEELSVLNDIATAVNITMSIEEVSRIIVSRCTRHLGAEQGAIFILAGEDRLSDSFKTYVRSQDSRIDRLPIHLDQQLKGWMLKNRKVLICNDPNEDRRFAGKDFIKRGVRSILAVPLLERRELIGMLTVFNKQAEEDFDDDDGRFLSIVGAQAATTLEKARLFQREAQFVRQVQGRRMQSLAQLVAGVAHEVNNPIGAVAGTSELLRRAVAKLARAIEDSDVQNLGDFAEIRNALTAIEKAASVIESGSLRVAEIVRRLKSFAQLDQSELQTIDVHMLMEDCLALLETRFKDRIKIEKNLGSLPKIRCYSAALNQVFFHVLLNATEAITGRGHIGIVTRSQDEFAVIEISDSGKGIPHDALSRVFDPGFTTKGVGVGTGLGLPICYQIIQSHNGEIDIQSEIDRGTKVTIRIPVEYST